MPQNSQENSCARVSFLIKLRGPATFYRRYSGQTLIKNFLKSEQVISGHSV